MSDSWQDSDFSFGYMEIENKEKVPEASKRFHRSVYGKESGKYLGEQGLFFPLFCLIFGFPLIGVGIFAVVTLQGDGQVVLSGIGFCFGGFCNFLAGIGLLAYFTGVGPEKGMMGRLRGDDSWDDYYE